MVNIEIIVGRKPVVVNGVLNNMLTTHTGKKFFVETDKDTGESALSYETHKAGDTFVATRNSSRKDAEGNPLYLKGETVERKTDSYEFIGFSTIEAMREVKSLQKA